MDILESVTVSSFVLIVDDLGGIVIKLVLLCTPCWPRSRRSLRRLLATATRLTGRVPLLAMLASVGLHGMTWTGGQGGVTLGSIGSKRRMAMPGGLSYLRGQC